MVKTAGSIRSTKKILFLVPYPLHTAPSQRFRVEMFLPELDKAGIQYDIEPFIDKGTWDILYKEGHFFLKAWGLLKGFIRRWWIMFFRLPFFRYVFIHREASPVGPPVFEWIAAKIFRKKIIYDFDDAIWIPSTSPTNDFVNWLKAAWKVKYICKWACTITVGNDYLSNYARQFNRDVIKIPTCIDLEERFSRTRRHHEGKLFVGWTGSHSTLKYLNEIMPVLKELQQSLDFGFIVIADKEPLLNLKDWRFIPWNASTEVEDLLQVDIGVMPLTADKWSEGKCGFKLIQYFACGIPAVASPVGVNKTIVEEGINGFLCNAFEEWKYSLEKLLTDRSLRQEMGMAGKQKVEEHYSIRSQAAKFIELFTDHIPNIPKRGFLIGKFL